MEKKIVNITDLTVVLSQFFKLNLGNKKRNSSN